MLPGIVLVMIGLIALMGGSVSWLLFGLFLWGLIALMTGGRRRRRLRVRREWAAAMAVAPAVMSMAPPRQQVPAAPQRARGRLPAKAQATVDRIRRKAELLAQHADQFPLGSRDLYVVQHTATDYLPTTIDAYLDVPPWSVNTAVAPDGRTAAQVLDDQLGLLEGKLDEIAESVQRHRVDRLLANERFLEENFGQRDREELTIPR